MDRYKIQTFVLTLMSLTLGTSEFIVVGILSDISGSLHVAQTSVGNLVTVFALVYAISTPFLSTFLGRRSLYRSLLTLTAVFIGGNLLSSVSMNYTLLLASRVITALVSGPMLSLAFAIANQITPQEKRAGVIAWIFSGFSIASVFGVPLGAWISVRAGWHMTFLAIVVFSVGVFVLLAALLPNRPAEHVKPMTQQFRLFTDRRVQIGVLLPMFGAAGIYVFYTYLRPIFSDVLHYSISALTMLFMLYGVATILSAQFSGVLARDSGLRKLPFTFAVEAALLLSLPLTLRFRIAGTILIMALGVVMYLVNSPVQLYFLGVAEKDYPEAIVLASSLSSIFFNFGISLGALIGGFIVDTVGLLYVGPGGGVLILITLFISIALNRVVRSFG
jgi:Arabinose efflux permease